MSAATAYEPRPGSVADRALAHMELLHKGSEISTSFLAQAVGCSPEGLALALKPAVEHGAVFVRQKGGHARSPMFWSLVDHSNNETPRAARRSTDGAGLEQTQVSDDAQRADGRIEDERLGARSEAVAPELLPPAAMSAAPDAGHRHDQRAEHRRSATRVPDAPCRPTNTPRLDSQHVLKAEAARPDATDRETPATASPGGGPMGAGQPAAAGPTGGVDTDAVQRRMTLSLEVTMHEAEMIFSVLRSAGRGA